MKTATASPGEHYSVGYTAVSLSVLVKMGKVYWHGQGLGENTVRAFLQRKPYDGKVDPIIEKLPVIPMNLWPSPKCWVFNDVTH